MPLVQKFIVEPAEKASPLLPQHIALVDAKGKPITVGAADGEATAEEAGIVRQAAHVDGETATVAQLVSALVEAGIMAGE